MQTDTFRFHTTDKVTYGENMIYNLQGEYSNLLGEREKKTDRQTDTEGGGR